MFDITLKESGKKYTLPLTPENWEEIKTTVDDSVINDFEFEVDYKSDFYDILPASADLEQLDNIAKDLEALKAQDKLDWLNAILDADRLGKFDLQITRKQPSKIEAAISGIWAKEFFFDSSMEKADYAKQEFDIGNLYYLNISDDLADCIDWEKLFDKFLSNTAIPVNGGILTVPEKI